MCRAHTGSTPLVPPIVVNCPSTRTMSHVAGEASPATSGTPRPLKPGAGDGGTPAFACHGGNANCRLTPPPVAPSPGSFHTTSLLMVVPVDDRFVPPHPRTKLLEAGKSTWGWPSCTPSLEPLFPAAQHTVTPRAAASWNA